MSQAILPQLREALSKIKRPGSFCASGSVPAVLPGLEVAGLGPIGFPLTARQAQKLKKLCDQARYGKGEETILDTTVRRGGRMTPDRFALVNPAWHPLLGQILATVQEELGLEKQKLECHLYELLLYESGDFFLPHRDGEKLDRMVATLGLVLPSSFEGGELVVRHDGQERRIDFRSAPDSEFQTHYAAFYADCEHEVRPLRSGYRLCLVYNLTLAKAKRPIAAPRDSQHIQTVSELLRQWAAQDVSRKLVVTLTHQYTQDGLAWDALKGVDRARAKVLREAAQQAGCMPHLALLTFWESGSAADDGSSYDYRRRYWQDDDDEDDDDNYEEDSGSHEMDEVFESSLTTEHWIDGDGNRLTMGKLTVEEEELLDPEALRDVEPEEEYEGYTGNEGMTLERWYRHAAVILWPETRHFAVLCDRDGRSAIPVLKRMVAQWRRARRNEAPALKTRCLDLAAAILATWPERRYSRAQDEAPQAGDLLETFAALGDAKPIAAFLGEVMVKDVSVEPGKSLPAVCEKYGWDAFQRELETVMEHTGTETLERNVRLLEQISLAKPRRKEGWTGLCQVLAERLVSALDQIDRQKPGYDWRAGNIDRAEVLAGLTRALVATGQAGLLSQVLTHALDSPRQYPLATAHVPALQRLRPWLKKNLKKPSATVSQWLRSCREQLEALTAEAPREPTDFRRQALLTCKCRDCHELKDFLDDPGEQVHRFRVKQERRNHLESCIRQHGCDLDCKTDRRGSPQTLVCTKNTASYQRKLKEYHEDQKRLATLLAIQASLPE